MTLLCSNLHHQSPSLLISRPNVFSGRLFLRQVNLNVNKGAVKISPIITCSKKKGSGGDKAVKSTFVEKVAKLEDNKFSHEGLVLDSLSNGMFRVKLDNEDLIIGYLSGKIRKNFVRVLPGDRVKVEMSPYDTTKGRIVYRIRNRDPNPGS